MSLTESRVAWSGLLSSLQKDLEATHAVDETIQNEAAFRDKFLALPRDKHVDDPDNNYAFFVRQHEPILSFAREIDQAVGLETPGSLTDTVWTVALIAIESAFEKEFDFPDFKAVYEDLNAGLPQDTDLASYPRDVRVQACLQTIFETYTKCYLGLIAQLQTDEEEIDFEPVQDQIDEAAKVYEDQYIEWKTRRAKAQEDQQNLLYAQQGAGENIDSRFEHLRDLGKGSYGNVDEVRETTTGTVYARKSIPIVSMGQDKETIAERVNNEADIMRQLRHNHIASVNMLFRSDRYWSIIMLPVADCDLRTFLDERCVKAGYPANNMRLLDPWFGCLISALAYAHDEQVKHEDIKPSNILIKGHKVYLSDFGTAKDFSELEASTVGGYMEQGTPVYWAPEPRAWGRPADVFALGCVFAEMLTVRQKKTLHDFRKFRFSPGKDFGYAYRSNLRQVKRWLKDFLGINSRDRVAQTILEQTLNMLIDDHLSRPDARRIKRQLRTEEDHLFCASCT